MIKVVSWNVGKREQPWRDLVSMARDGDADLVLLQEAGSPPGDLVDWIEYEDGVFWNRQLYDRWALVVKLSDRIKVRAVQAGPAHQQTRGRCHRRQWYRHYRSRSGGPVRLRGRSVRRSLHVRTLDETSSVNQQQLECWLLRCLGTSNHFGPVGIHWAHRPHEAQDPGSG